MWLFFLAIVCQAQRYLLVTAIVEAEGKPFDGTTDVTVHVSLEGVTEDHSVTVIVLSAYFLSPEVGNQTVVVTLELEGEDSEFYILTNPEVTLTATIRPAPTASPTMAPSTRLPLLSPSRSPSKSPTPAPGLIPTALPLNNPTPSPSQVTSRLTTRQPSVRPIINAPSDSSISRFPTGVPKSLKPSLASTAELSSPAPTLLPSSAAIHVVSPTAAPGLPNTTHTQSPAETTLKPLDESDLLLVWIIIVIGYGSLALCGCLNLTWRHVSKAEEREAAKIARLERRRQDVVAVANPDRGLLAQAEEEKKEEAVEEDESKENSEIEIVPRPEQSASPHAPVPVVVQEPEAEPVELCWPEDKPCPVVNKLLGRTCCRDDELILWTIAKLLLITVGLLLLLAYCLPIGILALAALFFSLVTALILFAVGVPWCVLIAPYRQYDQPLSCCRSVLYTIVGYGDFLQSYAFGTLNATTKEAVKTASRVFVVWLVTFLVLVGLQKPEDAQSTKNLVYGLRYAMSFTLDAQVDGLVEVFIELSGIPLAGVNQEKAGWRSFFISIVRMGLQMFLVDLLVSWGWLVDDPANDWFAITEYLIGLVLQTIFFLTVLPMANVITVQNRTEFSHTGCFWNRLQAFVARFQTGCTGFFNRPCLKYGLLVLLGLVLLPGFVFCFILKGSDLLGQFFNRIFGHCNQALVERFSGYSSMGALFYSLQVTVYILASAYCEESVRTILVLTFTLIRTGIKEAITILRSHSNKPQ
ncbi:YDG domain-containing protein [Nitratireductor sp. XY-223]|uniref:YDG domain-containing protein n=1 Tax=Nitratireductor sp. XY-223 TaxID=2561926 RepID=UPI001FF0742B|nr:YDG domain-containing protein [Nitratireductor sp. XY-223]